MKFTADNIRQAQSLMGDKNTKEFTEKILKRQKEELDRLESQILLTASGGICASLIYETRGWRYLGRSFTEDTIEVLRGNGFNVRDSAREGWIIISWKESND